MAVLDIGFLQMLNGQAPLFGNYSNTSSIEFPEYLRSEVKELGHMGSSQESPPSANEKGPPKVNVWIVPVNKAWPVTVTHQLLEDAVIIELWTWHVH